MVIDLNMDASILVKRLLYLGLLKR